MPKPSIRTLILLRKERDRIEADLRENDRKVAVETPAAIAQLKIGPGEEIVIKFAGESWRIIRNRDDGLRVIRLELDEDI